MQIRIWIKQIQLLYKHLNPLLIQIRIHILINVDWKWITYNVVGYEYININPD